MTNHMTIEIQIETDEYSVDGLYHLYVQLSGIDYEAAREVMSEIIRREGSGEQR